MDCKQAFFFILFLLLISSCSPASILTTEPLPTTTTGSQAPGASVQANATETTTGTSSASPSATRLSMPGPVVTMLSMHATPPISTTIGQRFRIDQRTTGTQDALKPIVLVLHTALLSGTSLMLRLGFENTTTQGYELFGGGSGKDAVLSDATGHEYRPLDVSSNLSSGIAPLGGWQPGAANVGDITFPQPTGEPPYTLTFPGYLPVNFRLDTPLPATATVSLSNGTYALSQTLYSTRDQLSKIELRVQSLEVVEDRLIFTVGFANTSRRGYDLIIGPKGGDARLLDAEGTAYAPHAVSVSLAAKIAPAGGWQPGQINTGTITFPKPLAADVLRFTFPEFAALSLRFDQHGLAEVHVTSLQGGTADPRPTPAAEDVAFTQLQQLLAAQAKALQNGDSDSYAANFNASLQDQQRMIVNRLKQIPVVTYTLELDSNASLSTASTGKLEHVAVNAMYTLRGIAPDNLFKNELLYTFSRVGNQWRVDAVDSTDNPPFWQLDDVVVRLTPHFLIIARPGLRTILPTLEKEGEAAYADLQARKLPMEERYVAYFASTESDFARLTGKAADRYLGVALSRYEVSNDTVKTLSRAFYINGAAFANSEQQHSTNARRVTITHELVHLVLARDTRPFTPPWLVEGAAVYYSEGDNPSGHAQLLSNGKLDDISLTKLTSATSLGAHDLLGTTTGYEYTFSGATIAYLVRTFGEDKMLAFYRSYAAVPTAKVQDKVPVFGGSSVTDSVMAAFSAKITPAAVQKFFGRDLDQLDHDVKAFLRK